MYRMPMAALAALFFAGPLAAQTAPPAPAAGGDIASEIVNTTNPAAFQVFGTSSPAKLYADQAVQGGHALRVAVPGADKDHPWSVSLSDPITKPVKAGDRLVLAFYAKVEKGDGGGTTAHLPSNNIQLAAAPYSSTVTGPVDIGPTWTLYHLAGKADKDYAAGALNVSLQLATGKQVLDFGPVFVLDLGQ